MAIVEPEFEIKDREGEKSLWVNGQNIWDLKPSELTPDVKKAIMSAYYIGRMQYREEIMHFDAGFFHHWEFKEDKDGSV